MKYGAQSGQAIRVQGGSFGNWRNRTPYAELVDLCDERLVEEIRAGNTDAFAVVFKRYHRLLHVTALNILRDAAEAEELTQTVFLEIYRRLGQFDPEGGHLKCGSFNTRTAGASIGETTCLWGSFTSTLN
jgi:hypothetical protein